MFTKKPLLTGFLLIFLSLVCILPVTANEAGDKGKNNRKQETLEADMVVIGGGPAGLSASLRGREFGMNVILLEKEDHLGGDPSQEGFSAEMGTAPEVQEEIVQEAQEGTTQEAQEESAQEAREETSQENVAQEAKEGTIEGSAGSENKKNSEKENSETASTLYKNHASATRQWLQTKGILFASDDDLLFDCDPAVSVMILSDHVEKQGVDILTNAEAEDLTIDDHSVVRVEAETEDTIYTIKAKTVVLATGQEDNDELLAFAGEEGGNLKVKSLQVLDAKGKAISGLYAAGAIIQDDVISDSPVLTGGWPFVSGKLAAEYAAEELGLEEITIPEETAADQNETGTEGTETEQQPENLPELYIPGEYTAEADGVNGPLVLTVTFSATAVTGITCDHQETPETGGEAIRKLTDEVLKNQGINFDAVTGATISSEAFRTALMDCQKQAFVF